MKLQSYYKIKRFEELKVGDVFLYCDAPNIKIEEIYDVGGHCRNAMILPSTKLTLFDDDIEVKCSEDATLTV